ncbi:hypothetical protein [Lapidilactobacillus luobeiensis]|uniref:hypothetical protein n=1 Tax=Lapidilactobacillus luobeiensis TaxID=2950371 RepID=UPI0021C29566|nr:hypothetical protein [Lapidilactobacillus luobeiensis]
MVDFSAPYDKTKYDASAGTCAACGLLEIAAWVAAEEAPLYRNAAIALLQATEANWVDYDPQHDGLVTHSSHSYQKKQETHLPLIYGDYYFVEGILRLLSKELSLW